MAKAPKRGETIAFDFAVLPPRPGAGGGDERAREDAGEREDSGAGGRARGDAGERKDAGPGAMARGDAGACERGDDGAKGRGAGAREDAGGRAREDAGERERENEGAKRAGAGARENAGARARGDAGAGERERGDDGAKGPGARARGDAGEREDAGAGARGDAGERENEGAKTRVGAGERERENEGAKRAGAGEREDAQARVGAGEREGAGARARESAGAKTRVGAGEREDAGAWAHEDAGERERVGAKGAGGRAREDAGERERVGAKGPGAWARDDAGVRERGDAGAGARESAGERGDVSAKGAGGRAHEDAGERENAKRAGGRAHEDAGERERGDAGAKGPDARAHEDAGERERENEDERERENEGAKRVVARAHEGAGAQRSAMGGGAERGGASAEREPWGTWPGEGRKDAAGGNPLTAPHSITSQDTTRRCGPKYGSENADLRVLGPTSLPWAPPPLPERPERAPASAPKPDGPRVLTVGQLGRVVGRSLERTFAAELWVEGEVSGARPAASGHVYFAMKDEQEDAAIDVVLYRSSVTPRGRALVKDGNRVRVRGKPTYWSPRGKLQFVGDRVEPTGKGALLEALEKLKEKLQAEGLFAAEKKRALPHDPRVIGVVTSASGAVIHDICKVAFRRGGARILLAAAQVQGPGATDSIRRALRMLQRVAEVDVIVLGRGGGSSDDLIAFNDELVVRDVAACRVPIVSAVGHEVDVTLVDFAADARAATPSQAAEMIVPDLAARRRLLEERTRRMERAMRARLAEEQARQAQLMRAFRDPRLLIASSQQRIDELTYRLTRTTQRGIAREKELAASLDARLRAQHPEVRIGRDRARLAELEARLAAATKHDVRDRAALVAKLAGRLDAMSPLKVLARGYAIVTKDGHAVRDASEVTAGDQVHVRVGEGAFEAEVK